MRVPKAAEWRKLPLSLTELSINTTLQCGQSFRWRNINDEWLCTLHGRLVTLRQDSSHLHYRVLWPEKSPSPGGENGKAAAPVDDIDDTEALLRHYLSLKVDLEALYAKWSRVDANFRKHAPQFTGVRILSQDAWETVVSFICSSNNNISRISQMVHKLCITYGPLIGRVEGIPFHDFPPPEALTGDGVEAKLRELGFGYRAKYIAATAKVVASKPAGWLNSLRNPEEPAFPPPPSLTTASTQRITYREAHKELLQLSGVGPKVADCVCLMGLGWAEAVPVDTHVWQIAQRDYKFARGKAKTFSVRMYDPVGDFFRELWGKEAGWAHSVLFTADLKTFASRLAKDEAASGVKEAKDEITSKVKEEEGDTAVLVDIGAAGRGAAASRKRLRTLSLKMEGEEKPELKLPTIGLLQDAETGARRRSPRIRKKESQQGRF